MNRREELLAMLEQLGITTQGELEAAFEDVQIDISQFVKRKDG